MYLSLIITFLLLLVVIITAIQNSMPLDFKFFTWDLQISITALILYSSIIGGAIVAILTLPKLVKKSLNARSMNKKIHELKEKILYILDNKSISENFSKKAKEHISKVASIEQMFGAFLKCCDLILRKNENTYSKSMC